MAPVTMMQLLQGYLQAVNERQQLIATNMANADTPGYQTQDLNFQSALQDAMDQGGPQAKPASEDVQGLPERADGNNVSIDRESMLMSQTQLQYQMGVQLIRTEFGNLLTAIKES